MPPTVAFAGLGSMGRPMAVRLARAGYPLRVHDLDPTAAEAVRRAAPDVTVAADVAGLAAGADLLVTMLPSGAAVRSLVTDAAPHLAAGATVVDMSSSEPVGTRELGAALDRHAITLIDAPVSGGVTGARDGTLAIMAGGPSDAVDRVRPLLSVLGSRILPTGPLGSGHAAKALNNLLSAAGLLLSAEALLTGARFGLDPATLLDVVNASSGRNNSTERKIRPFVLSRAFDAGFSAELMLKDVRIAVDLAETTGTPAPLAHAALALWGDATATLAPGADHTAVVTWYERQAGTELA